MISQISGPVIDKEENSVVIQTGGIGLQVFISPTWNSQLKLRDTCTIYTHLIVRETELSLYGFETKEERKFFILLMSVNGVGPKLSMTILASMSPELIRRAVFSEQPELFNNVSGVGKKTAQKILLQLQDKVTPSDEDAIILHIEDHDGEVIAALTSLGYSLVEAQSAIQMIPNDAPDDVEDRLRLALQYFA
jgi:holliday junction DNA helicase RuvA